MARLFLPLAFTLLVAMCSSALHTPMQLIYWHSSGIGTSIPLPLYPTRTLEITGMAPYDQNVVDFWAARNQVVTVIEVCHNRTDVQSVQTKMRPADRSSSELLRLVKVRLNEIMAKRLLPNGGSDHSRTVCDKFIMWTDWQMEYNASSALYSDNVHKYAESPMTAWLDVSDPFYTQCDPMWGRFGIRESQYAGNVYGFNSNSSMLSFRDGLHNVFGIDAGHTFDYSESLGSNHYDRVVRDSRTNKLIADIHFDFNTIPVEEGGELMPALDWQCFYYVNEAGEYIPCGFRTGEWIAHAITDSDTVIYPRHASLPYSPRGFIPLYAYLYYGIHEYYDFEMVENYQSNL
jgi:hypothetical protein